MTDIYISIVELCETFTIENGYTHDYGVSPIWNQDAVDAPVSAPRIVINPSPNEIPVLSYDSRFGQLKQELIITITAQVPFENDLSLSGKELYLKRTKEYSNVQADIFHKGLHGKFFDFSATAISGDEFRLFDFFTLTVINSTPPPTDSQYDYISFTVEIQIDFITASQSGLLEEKT